MAQEMKYSGIEWLEEIPKNWNVNRIKNIFRNGKGLPITKENLVDEGLAVISYGQIHSKTNTGVTIDDNLLRFVDFKYRKYYPQCQVYQYDFIFADTSEDSEGCGNCIYKRDKSELFAGYHAIILHSIEPQDNRYLAYLFKTDCWRKQIREAASGVKVFSITQKILINSSIIVPPFAEQQKIADYLDKKCGEIDALLLDIQSQISLLEYYKKSVITEAVTKGLDPDAEMKDSGIEWIGTVPKEWNMCRIKDTCQIVRGGSPRPINQYMSDAPDDINWIRISDTTKGYKYIDGTEQKIFKSGMSSSRLAHKGDLLLTNSMSFGQPYILNIDGCIHDGWLAFSKYKNIDKEFLYYVLMSELCMTQFILSVAGAVVVNLNIDKVGATKIFLPTILGQRRIVEYLDMKCLEIDAMMAEKREQLEVLEQYKKSLIYEYVTGKKEVQ